MSTMNALTRGVVVFIALAVLTAVEYIVGVREAPVAVMALLAIVKAGLVVWFFMHIKRVITPSDEGGHS